MVFLENNRLIYKFHTKIVSVKISQEDKIKKYIPKNRHKETNVTI